MHPEFFGSVRAYPVFLTLGEVVGIAVALFCGRRAGIAWQRLAAALVLLTAAALGGAKLYGLIERSGAVGSLGSEIFTGYRYPGGLIGCVLGIWVVAHSPFLRLSPGFLADVVAPSFGFAMAVARIGCLLAGCCAGRICDLPWAIQFPHGSQPWQAQLRAGLLSPDAPFSLPVHPLQLYFALFSLVLGVFALAWQSRKAYHGQVFLLYVALHGIGKFFLEFLRFGPLPQVQYASLILGLLAAAVLIAKALSSPSNAVARPTSKNGRAT